MNEQMIGRRNVNAVTSTEESKKIAEVQGKMILARQFPRDIATCMQMIALECENKDLAEKAIYEFPRGDSVVRGASIRLVECVARYWGNIISGIEELSSTDKGATVRAYCWDLQTNFADEKVFDVAFIRSTKKGNYPITDPRDRYEKMANDAARRKRACIQAVIPKHVIDKAMALCEATLEADLHKEDIAETKLKMLDAFKNLAEWIGEAELGEVCGKKFDKLSARDIVKLRNLYNAIKDGFVKPETAFKKEEPQRVVTDDEAAKLQGLNSMLANVSADQKNADQQIDPLAVAENILNEGTEGNNCGSDEG